MTPEAIEAAITSDTSAIIVVHVLGGAVDVAAVEAIARRRKLWLFEDTCEALGVAWDGNNVGSFGQLASFSFYFSHHITTIEGGMVVTDDARLADLLRRSAPTDGSATCTRARSRGRLSAHDPRFLFLTTGFNVRPTEINGAIGLQQLKKLSASTRAGGRSPAVSTPASPPSTSWQAHAHPARSARHARTVRLHGALRFTRRARRIARSP